jgi:glycerate-2-kinase
MYDEVGDSLNKIFRAKDKSAVVLAAGEPKLLVNKSGGTGGRNLFMGLRALQMGLIDGDRVFIPLASDGMDNSDAAGAVIDKSTLEKIEKLGLNLDDYIDRYDAYTVFQKSGDIVMTGPTGANVSDLMILLSKKP